MPWFVVPAAIATIGLVGKLLNRHVHGQRTMQALEDPPGIRTVARFELDDGATTEAVLLAVAAELARGFDHPVEITSDAVRARSHPLAPKADIVRLTCRDPIRALYTLELTRAWTGVTFGDEALAFLHRIHAALGADPKVVRLTWHARQDRGLADGFAMPAFVASAQLR